MDIPQELIDKIIDWVWDADGSPPHATTKATSLISRAWVNRSQHHLFHSVEFDPIYRKFGRWCDAVTPGPNGASRHVRSLTIQGGWQDGWWIDEDALGRVIPYFDSFCNVQTLRVLNWDVESFPPKMLTRCFAAFAEGVRALRWDPHQYMTLEAWNRILGLFPLVDHLLLYPDSDFFQQSQLSLTTPAGVVRKKLIFFGSYGAKYLTGYNLRFHEIHMGCDPVMSFETLITVIGRSADRLEILSIAGISRVINQSNAGTLGSVLGGCHALRELSLDLTPVDEPSEPYLIDTIPGDRLQLLRIMPSLVIWQYLWIQTPSDAETPRFKTANERLAQAIRRLGIRFSSKNSGRKLPVWFVIPQVPYIISRPIRDSVIALWEAVEDVVSFGFEMTGAQSWNIDKRRSVPGLYP